MIRWKCLREDPPAFNTTICLKIGRYYDVFAFVRYSDVSWGLVRDNREYDMIQVTKETLYIDLEQIQNEYGLQDELPF